MKTISIAMLAVLSREQISAALLNENLLLSNGRGIFGQYNDINQMVDERIKEKGHSVEQAISLLSETSANAPKSFFEVGQLNPTHCHDMLVKLQTFYNSELQSLEYRAMKECFQKFVIMDSLKDSLILRKKEIEETELPKAKSDIETSTRAFSGAELLVNGTKSKIKKWNEQCAIKMDDLLGKLQKANTTMIGMKGTGDQFDSILTNHSLLRGSNLAQVSKHGIALSIKDEICKSALGEVNEYLNLNEALKMCNNTTDIKHQDLVDMFDKLYNNSVHDFHDLEIEYNNKVLTCNQTLQKYLAELKDYQDDLNLQEKLLSHNETLKSDLDTEIIKIGSDLEELTKNSTILGQSCSEEIKNVIDNTLCPTKIMRDVLVEKCDDFKEKEIIDCQMSGFVQDDVNCVCSSDESYSMKRSIEQTGNSIGFNCTGQKTSILIKCVAGQEMCKLQEYWGIVFSNTPLTTLMSTTTTTPLTTTTTTLPFLNPGWIVLAATDSYSSNKFLGNILKTGNVNINGKHVFVHNRFCRDDQRFLSGQEIDANTRKPIVLDDGHYPEGVDLMYAYNYVNPPKVYNLIYWIEEHGRGVIIIMKSPEQLAPSILEKIATQDIDGKQGKVGVIVVGADTSDSTAKWIRQFDSASYPCGGCGAIDYLSRFPTIVFAITELIDLMMA